MYLNVSRRREGRRERDGEMNDNNKLCDLSSCYKLAGELPEPENEIISPLDGHRIFTNVNK